jgi:WD40 repeat protein
VKVEEQRVVTLAAHNYLEVFNLNGSLISRTYCQEECILYSGDIASIQDSYLVVSGTVFRSILIWKAHSSHQLAPVLCRLAGHTGVVFDTRFLKAEPLEIIVGSVSDDRSLRIWRSTKNSEEMEFTQERELYGHRSRIWRLDQTSKFYATVSEDACRLWLKDTLHAASHKPFDTLRGHMGKNIRALAVHVGSEDDLLATGGEDGAIKVYNISQMQNPRMA